MKNSNPWWIELCAAQDAIRLGDESPEALARCEAAEAAFKAAKDAEPKAEYAAGWWNLPVAGACFEADARDIER